MIGRDGHINAPSHLVDSCGSVTSEHDHELSGGGRAVWHSRSGAWRRFAKPGKRSRLCAATTSSCGRLQSSSVCMPCDRAISALYTRMPRPGADELCNRLSDGLGKLHVHEVRADRILRRPLADCKSDGDAIGINIPSGGRSLQRTAECTEARRLEQRRSPGSRTVAVLLAPLSPSKCNTRCPIAAQDLQRTSARTMGWPPLLRAAPSRPEMNPRGSHRPWSSARPRISWRLRLPWQLWAASSCKKASCQGEVLR